ncbi:hypothetical protein LINPERPRIM_LOCUS40469 [Linum perenne]
MFRFSPAFLLLDVLSLYLRTSSLCLRYASSGWAFNHHLTMYRGGQLRLHGLRGYLIGCRMALQARSLLIMHEHTRVFW